MRKPTLVTLPFFLTILAIATPRMGAAQTGYTFRAPLTTVSLRLGAGVPYANDDLFHFFSDQLTLDRKDFRGVAVAADVGLRVVDRFDIVVGVAWDGTVNHSEFRDWVDNDDQPIEQTTEFNRIPITVSAKYYLLPRGRAVSRHAWVPNKVAPYLSAGGGMIIYNLVQDGDWVDYRTLDVFTRRFSSTGTGPTAHAGGGAEIWVNPRLAINADGRYQWGSATLQRDFSDFDKID
ncbi:MAG TPA: hypothetical protein VM100_08300, partial [Longimicrobiales bacterium]|nr:hypothetical protein [Longimicrobiales bacterium]